MAKEKQLVRAAEEIEQHLRAVRQVLRRPAEAEFARGGLTGPQRSVMQALVRADGLSLKELCSRVGLAHSTVSGIVDRLEKRGLVKRRPDPSDRRLSRIVVSKEVRRFKRHTLPALLIHPVVEALRGAQPGERRAILKGLRTLRRLVQNA